ncbi:MAG TPA: serine hydrolase domain-containing protein [Luteolibacter sp.]|nr:serine hydrolase domain-containing protein [Luteolibacter sp.]
MSVSPSALGEVMEVFERNFRERGELGASVSIWWDGAELLSTGDGWCEKEQQRPWTETTLVPVYSATKGPAAATLLTVLEESGLGPATPVREVWERFPIPEATFSDLLSHRCGLAALDVQADLLDHDSVVAAIEAQSALWALGDGHGYHPRTFGALVDEPVRRLTGKTLGNCWREKIAEPLGLDFWIGLPESEWPRVARLYPGKAAPSDLEQGFYKEFNDPSSLTRRAFTSPRGLQGVNEMNGPAAWSAGLPAMGGVGTARALAKFYQVAIGAMPGLSEMVRAALAAPVSSAFDKVLLKPTVFTCGCQRDLLDGDGRKLRKLYGESLSAFGHPGAGGSHAFGDPETGISFGYTMNQMEMSVMPGPKCVDMITALYS